MMGGGKSSHLKASPVSAAPVPLSKEGAKEGATMLRVAGYGGELKRSF